MDFKEFNKIRKNDLWTLSIIDNVISILENEYNFNDTELEKAYNKLIELSKYHCFFDYDDSFVNNSYDIIELLGFDTT